MTVPARRHIPILFNLSPLVCLKVKLPQVTYLLIIVVMPIMNIKSLIIDLNHSGADPWRGYSLAVLFCDFYFVVTLV